MVGSEEIILNLWYVHDEEGIIYSLRAKTYAAEGSDEEKLVFLQQRATIDYLVAESFEIPTRFHLRVSVGTESKVMPVAHVSMLRTLDSPIALFEDAIKQLDSCLPVQSQLGIGRDPLVCTTPLVQNQHGVIEPQIGGRIRY